MAFTAAPPPAPDGLLRLEPDGWKKEEEECLVVESLKKELKTKHRELYVVQRDMRVKLLEWHKIQFKRAMEKALSTNCIIKERSLLTRRTTPDFSGRYLMAKAQDFNKKIKCAICMGLDGILFGPPSNKRKHPSSDDKEMEMEMEMQMELWELEEELEDLKKRNEAVLLQIVPENMKKVEIYCKRSYRRARPFAKLESREEGLKCIINSLFEREAREIVFRPTENELLGYMLVKETANSTLQYPHILFPPNSSLELPPCSTPPPSSYLGGEDEKIVVGLESRLFTGWGVNSYGCTFNKLVASNCDSMLKDAQSAANKSDEMKLIKEFITMLEEMVTKEQGKSCIIESRTSQLMSERCFEEKLVAHYGQLSDMRLARCLNQFSETERTGLEEIVSLANKAIDKYALVKGLPGITRPVLPSYPSVASLAPPQQAAADVAKKEEEEEEKVKKDEEQEELLKLEHLKRELKAKHTEAYFVKRELRLSMLEWHKITFTRTLEKAWLTNSIIKGRCLLVHPVNQQMLHKALVFNEKIKRAISQGLSGFLFAPSNKRKRIFSSDEEGDEKILVKLEELESSCEDRLASIVNSLLERERESEREATQNEILGYMLLQEISQSTLCFPPNTSLFSSVDVGTEEEEEEEEEEEGDEKILVGVKMRILLLNLFKEHANEKSNETSWACMYDDLLTNAKLASNNSVSEEMELIKQSITQAEALIEAAKKGLSLEPSRMSKLAAERTFETKLVAHCQDLSHMRLATCLKQPSQTEINRFEEILCLASNALDKYREAKGTDSLPQITQPVLPTYRPY